MTIASKSSLSNDSSNEFLTKVVAGIDAGRFLRGTGIMAAW